MRKSTLRRGGVNREIDVLVAVFVGTGVWTSEQGETRRRAFERELREDDDYIRTGRRGRS